MAKRQPVRWWPVLPVQPGATNRQPGSSQEAADQEQPRGGQARGCLVAAKRMMAKWWSRGAQQPVAITSCVA